MKNDQMSGSKAGNTRKGFQNDDKFEIDTKGAELLPTLSHIYDITGHACDQERHVKAS